MNALAAPVMSAPQPPSVPLLRTLVLCDLVDSTALVERLGDRGAADLFRKHDRLARTLVQARGGREIDKTDGFLFMFDRPIQAVGFALEYQRALKQLNAEANTSLAVRVGIHVGDVLTWDNTPADIAKGAKQVEVEGLVKPITSRLMQLALPNQILLSGVAYSLAHRAQGELGSQLEAVRWRSHGRYRFKGIPDPIPVFEVGDEGLAPLKPPPWSGKAHREVPFWRRPASVVIESLVLLVLIAIPAWYLVKPAPAIAFANRDWVVVGDLKNLTGDSAFDESLDTAFRIGLEQSRYVNVMSTLKTRETLALMQRDPAKTAIDRSIGSEVAIRDGARALILPTVAEIGGRVRVTAEVIDPNTQTTVWSESADGAGADSVLPSLDKVNAKLRVRLGEALATVSSESKPLDNVATANLDALRAYSLGFGEYTHGNFTQAGLLFRQAIKLDPDFALAHLNLANVLSATSPDDNAEALLHFRTAARLASRLSPREALYAQAALANLESPRKALDKWRLLSKLYPDFYPASGALGFRSYVTANNIPAAIAATQLNTVSNNARRAIGQYLLGALYLGAERYGPAQKAFEDAVANGFSTQGAYHAYLFATQRKFDKAENILAQGKVSGDAGLDSVRPFAQFLFALDRGEWDRMSTMLVDIARKATAEKNMQEKFAFMQLELRSLSEPRESFDPALKTYVYSHTADANPDSRFRLLFSAYLAAHAGDIPLAKLALGRAGKPDDDADYPYLVSLRSVVDAELARVGGDPQKAIALLKSHEDGNEYYFSHRAMMDAQAAHGDHASALAEAQWLATHRGKAYAEQFGQDLLQPFNVALSDLALLDAAELSLALQRPEAARRSLAQLHSAWSNAAALPFLARRLRSVGAALGEAVEAAHTP